MHNFIESGKKGTVLFSLGTNLHAADLGKELLQKFLEAFRQMPNYNFLWKLDDAKDVSENVPKNVMIQPWVPQTDVFAHPNIKAFMTHSGLLSTQEAAWFGIPMITIPFFMDQFRVSFGNKVIDCFESIHDGGDVFHFQNSYRCIQFGLAEEVDFMTTTSEIIRNTVLKVLETPKYKENSQLVSKRFRDQKEKPIDRAVWWIEWVIRNPDASHLQSPVQILGSFRANNYDVLLISFLLVIVTTVYLTRCMSQPSKIPAKKKTN
jgi:glucuronosyltransferase